MNDFLNFHLSHFVPLGCQEWVFGGRVETLGEVQVQQKCISIVGPCGANISRSLQSLGPSRWETEVK